MVAYERIELAGPIEVVTEQGLVFSIRPSLGGKGIAVVPKLPRSVMRSLGRVPDTKARRGRPPRPSTLALRKRLAEDVKAGKIFSPSHYMEWLQKEDPTISYSGVRQTVYKERSAFVDANPDVEVERRPPVTYKPGKQPSTRTTQGGRGGNPGRPPHPVTEELRKLLESHAAKDNIKDANHYVHWYLKRRPDANPGSVRNTVFRERRAYLGVEGMGGKAAAVRRRRSRGRGKASPALEPVRQAIQADAPDFRDLKDYVKVALEADQKMGKRAAKGLVYRELRTAKEQ